MDLNMGDWFFYLGKLFDFVICSFLRFIDFGRMNCCVVLFCLILVIVILGSLVALRGLTKWNLNIECYMLVFLFGLRSINLNLNHFIGITSWIVL
jgi:hypothetical protein